MALSAHAQVLCMLIITGAVAASPSNIALKAGDSLPATIVTGFSPNVPCYLNTPQGDVIEFRPDNNSTERITYIETAIVSYCGAHISNLTEEDEGEWTINFIDGDVIVSKTYLLSIEKDAADVVDNEENKEEKVAESESQEEEDDIVWLRDINISTRTGLNVDISLSKKVLDTTQTEKFTITTPNGETVQLENVDIAGVTVHGSSDFVASRVTIGPMETSLLGRWTLCGQLNEGKPSRRCQSVAISWNNLNNPSAEWDTSVRDKRDTVTNYLAIIDTGVSDWGTLATCHIITPAGEDLVLTSDTTYPGITFIPSWDNTACRVLMGPVHKEFLGDWTVYASFRRILGGIIELRLPLHLFLYDEEDPYKQAYNVTTLEPLTRVVNLGTNLNVEIPGSGTTDSCELKSPSGQLFNLEKSAEPVTFLETGLRVSCAVSIGPIGQETLGAWEIVSKFNDGRVYTESKQTIHIIQEDPQNPIMEDHRTLITKDMIYFNTKMGAEHTVVVDQNAWWFWKTESCHLRNPKGLQYTFMDGFNHPGVEITDHPDDRCSVKITVESEDIIGEWTLISREQRSPDLVEVRQPFTILVEENVDALASEVTVSEGNDLHLRLANPTNQHDSCKLYEPSGTERTDRDVDASQTDTCGFIVRNVQNYDSGVWQIRYGAGISYRANVNVVVKDLWESTNETIILTRGRSVNKTIGPETAQYCKLTDPTERVAFEGHGTCHLTLGRVTNDHAGTWIMQVGILGNMLARTYQINIVVRGSEHKPLVSTYVAKEQPEVTLMCSVPSEYEVRSCLYKEPSGRVIIVNHGVAEDRYISHGSGTTVKGNVTTHECGLRITDPAAADLGLWRCAVETDHEVYYGFLTVLCPWAMQDPLVAATVVSEPTLTAHKENITHLEGDSLTMSCSIQSAIQYCYFRGPNGMTYSASPGVPSDEFEYVGAGFDSGECGIRFNRLPSQDQGHWPEGRWSCHVGLPLDNQPEQRADMQVQIIRPIEVNQYDSAGDLMVEAGVYLQQPLEYCRYVRIDGLGFKSSMLPDARYFSYEQLSRGICRIRIVNPTILEMHPWTIAAKIEGRDEEILGVTSHTMQMPSPGRTNNYIWWWCTSIFAGVILVCIGILLITPKNRRMTIARATSLRNSIRRSFAKKPLPDDDSSRTTPISA